MQLDDALRQISDIRQHMARTEVFRGYRSATVAFSGFAALIAAALQPLWVQSPQNELGRYLAFWLAIAAASLCAAGAEIYYRTWRSGDAAPNGLARQHTRVAAQQFLPSLAVGAILTLCIAFGARDVAWMLPGLWCLIFALGIFASHRLFPRPALWVAVHYTLCGCGCLLWGQGEHALSPWLMGISFGGGQLLAAAILYWTLERTDAPSTCE